MFDRFAWSAEILENPELTSGDKAVAFALTLWMDKTGALFPLRKTIAERIHISTRHLSRNLKSLENHNHIVIDGQTITAVNRTPMSGHRTPMSGHRTPMSGHQTPPTGHTRPVDRTPMSGHRTPPTGHTRPVDRTHMSPQPDTHVRSTELTKNQPTNHKSSRSSVDDQNSGARADAKIAQDTGEKKLQLLLDNFGHQVQRDECAKLLALADAETCEDEIIRIATKLSRSSTGALLRTIRNDLRRKPDTNNPTGRHTVPGDSKRIRELEEEHRNQPKWKL